MNTKPLLVNTLLTTSAIATNALSSGMDINPLDVTESGTEANSESHREAHSRLNTLVAITVALLATFMGLCKVKDDNIVQAMQQAQADRIDHWSYYQAKNVREEVARAAADQLRAQAVAQPGQAKVFTSEATRYDSIAGNEAKKKEEIRKQAEGDQTTYDAYNYRDDQFDLSDALAAIAISLLAVTSLTNKRWLYYAALIPTALALLMGTAGLAGLKLHSNFIAGLLS